MKVLEVSARKGGVGTSTVAASLAVSLSISNPYSVLLIDPSDNADVLSIMGLSVPFSRDQEIVDGIHGLTIRRPDIDKTRQATAEDISAFSFVVIDAGLRPRSSTYFGTEPFRISVVTNSYLSLRAQTLSPVKPDAHVCLYNDQLVLTSGDVRSVLGRDALVRDVAVDPAVSRAIDAGLYTLRTNLYEGWTNEFIREHGLTSPVSA